MNSPNRRRHSRSEGNETIGAVYMGRRVPIRDLSLGGVFVVDRYPLPEGKSMNLDLELPDSVVPVRGVVTRSTDGEGMAVRFTLVPVECEILIKSYLASQPSTKRE